MRNHALGATFGIRGRRVRAAVLSGAVATAIAAATPLAAQAGFGAGSDSGGA